jgi:predicted permease
MRDLRYAIRVLLKAPVFALTAILTLALCIGANTAIYTVVDRVLLRPLPYPRPDRLAMVVRHYQGAGASEDDVSQAGVAWVALRDGTTGIDLAVFGMGMGVNLVAGGQAEYVMQQRVSAGYFKVLGVPPALGREFNDDEDRVNGPAAAILSHALWTHAFGADPGILGRAVTLRGAPHTIVGVMPAAFRSNAPCDVWTPLRPSPVGEGGGENYGIVARLKNGVSWAEADGQVASAAAEVVRDRYRNSRDAVRLGLLPMQQGLTEDTRAPILAVWAAVGIVLLIGCVNVAGLLLARGAARAQEIATRIALGGGRAAIVRQLLTESLVLAACGGAAGIALGYGGSRVFATWLEDAFGITGELGLDGRVLAISVASALLTSIIFGLLPALQASRVNLRETLVESGGPNIAGHARSWVRRVMVGTEVALGVVLLVGAGLLIRTFDYLISKPAGFDSAHVLTATLSLQDARYETSDRVAQLFERTLARMREVPGVQKAAVALTLPYERALNDGFRLVGGDPSGRPFNLTYVTSEYFDALHVPLKRGRLFTDADAVGAPVIIVNETFVRRHSPDQDPIGRQIVSNGVRTIVGVVGDVQTKTAFGNFGPVGAGPAAYVPPAHLSAGYFRTVHTWFSPSWIVKLAGPQEQIIEQMQRAVQSVDPQLPFAKFRTLDDVRGQAVATPRAQAALLSTLAGLALLLAAIGLYGLMASSVAERTRELGIRLALGASSRQAIVSAAAPGLLLGAIGVAAGLAIARAGATTMSHLVWGVSVNDPLTFALAAGAVLLVAVIATLVPAVRIARVNPIKALRQA